MAGHAIRLDRNDSADRWRRIRPSQQGNNNAYAQDNALNRVDWAGRDRALEDYVAGLDAWRAARADWFTRFPEQGQWMRLDGRKQV